MPTIGRMPGDIELATRLREHGAAGLADVYSAYADRLFGYAVTITRDRELSADAVHDTFLVAVDRIGQLREPDRLRPWLFAITRNECLRRLRDRNRFASTADSQEVLDAMGDEPDLTAGISRAEAADLVQSAMVGLSPADRDVLTLAIGADLDPVAVGSVLGVDSKGVHARLSRAREALGASVTALVLARTRGRDCADLAGILRESPRFDPLLRKRISRHVKQCDTCERRGRAAALACAPALAAPVVAVSAPSGLSDRLFGPHGSAHDAQQVAAAGARSGPFGPDGFPEPLVWGAGATDGGSVPPPGTPRDDGGRRRVLLAATMAGLLLVLGVVAWTTRAEPSAAPADSPPTAPAQAPSAVPSAAPADGESSAAVAPTASSTGAADPVPSGAASAGDANDKAPGKTDATKAEDDTTPDAAGAADSPAPKPRVAPPPDPAAEESGTADSSRQPAPGAGSSKDPKKQKQSGAKKPQPRPEPTPTPSPTPKPAPAPGAPRITALSVTDLDRAPDGSFTRCDAFRMSVSATAAGQVTSGRADYGSGSFPLSRNGTRWRGVTTLPPGEYTVTVRLTGPGGAVTRTSPSVLHICPG